MLAINTAPPASEVLTQVISTYYFRHLLW